MISFDGKVAIVTGAGSPTGIGFASARGFAEGGASVVCVDVTGAEAAADSLGSTATGFTMDVRDGAAWAALVADVVAKFGRIDILVNNAGIAVAGDRAAEVSEEAHIGLRDAAAYCASKGAVLALTRQAGVQYASRNVQINSVSPGTTMTGLQRDVTEQQRAAFLPLTPIGRFADAPEVAAAVLFLCSEGSSFMAGADMSVDGGMVAL
jgi:NAD(P)-dependent dehydrogenase (short-subunit alcohol dehydrogenase family)